MSFLVEKQKDDAEKSFNLEKVKFNKQCEDERRKINLEREEMHNYIKEEKIEATEEEALKEVTEMAQKYNMTEEDVKNSLGGIDAMIYDIKVRKALDLMKKEEQLEDMYDELSKANDVVKTIHNPYRTKRK